jgi:hypothetical protein
VGAFKEHGHEQECFHFHFCSHVVASLVPEHQQTCVWFKLPDPKAPSTTQHIWYTLIKTELQLQLRKLRQAAA